METLAGAILLIAVGVVTWGFRLEGRVNTQEKVSDTKFENLKQLLEVEFKNVSQRLDRIERSLNGHLVRD